MISDIALTPEESLGLPIDSECCLTATVTEDGSPVVGTNVHFEIIAGPQAGLTHDALTDANGEAVFCSVGAVEGVDTIVASFVDGAGATQSSNQAVCEFVAECHLVIGNGTGPSGAWQPDYHVFFPEVGDIQESHAVLMDDIPSFPLPSVTLQTISPTWSSAWRS